MTVRSLFTLTIVPLLLILTGCGAKSDGKATLTGKVTINGQPVTGGVLHFFSANGAYTAVIDPQGNYQATDLPTGEMTVTVENEYLNPEKKMPVYAGQTSGPANSAIKGSAANSKYGKMIGGHNASSTYKGPGVKLGPTPEGGDVKEGTYVKIPAIYTKKETSTCKINVESGSNEKNIELTGK